MQQKIVSILPQSIHFIGIGGIGMSALARFCLQRGIKVKGSNPKTYGSLLPLLEQEGAEIFHHHDAQSLQKDTQCVVASSIIPEDNPEIQAAKHRNIPVLSRSDLMRLLLKDYDVLAVSGTHGKTTTTSLLGRVFTDGQADPTIFSGGIMHCYNSNFRMGKSSLAIVEADESDKSFLNFDTLWGNIVTNIEEDHMRTYGTFSALVDSFQNFIKLSDQISLLCGEDPLLKEISQSGTHRHVKTYGFHPDCWIQAHHIRQIGHQTFFDVFLGSSCLKRDVQMTLLGKHNVLNALAVIGMAYAWGLPIEAVSESISAFKGVERRLMFTGTYNQILCFDDYAHHPTEIKAVLSALRQHFPEKKLMAVCQPHRYSRLKTCWNQFETCFDEADYVVLLPVYGLEEKPIPGISSEDLYQRLTARLGKRVSLVEDNFVSENRLLADQHLRHNDVIVFLGAGDITVLAHQLPERY